VKILAIGDIMVDRYTYVRSSRRAAEAPIPVWDQVGWEARPGGAANLAVNLKSLCGPDDEVKLCGIMGMDMGAETEADNYTMFQDFFGLDTEMVVNGSTMVKHRYVDRDSGQYVFRHDNFQEFLQGDVVWFESAAFGLLREEKFDAVVISDYGKGTITPTIISYIRDIPLAVVDSKRNDLRIFEGMNVLKVNEPEYSAQVSSRLYPNFTKFFEYCVVTKGEKGADLLQCEQVKSDDRRYMIHTESFPVQPQKATDVTGCGDTFTAAMTVELLRSRDVRRAVKFANFCAGKKVQKFGTATPDL
jgi:rfaE bifunctional protein kinase chain/domain